jgi:hypothetical protein
MTKPATMFVAKAPLTLKSHLGNEVRVQDGTVLHVSSKGKLVIPAHQVKLGKKGFKDIPAVTTAHYPIDLQKWLSPVVV